MLANVFSWSKSRDEEFRECQRKYFYSRYLSWGGWDKSSDKRIRLAYIYKNLKNRYAWKGERVHHVIEYALKALRSGSPVTLDQSIERLTTIMRADYKSSKSGRNMDDPKNNLGLFEHVYQKPVSDITWKELHESSVECLRNFYRSEFYSKDLSADDKNQWLVIEDLEDYSFEGSKIYVKLDFARAHNGQIEIYDWKTGKTEAKDAWIQIGTYILYAVQKWKIPAEKIQAYLFNLTSVYPTAAHVPMDDRKLEEARQKIQDSIESMHSMLSDVKSNTPKPEEEFAYAQNEKICQNCAFQKICTKYNSN